MYTHIVYLSNLLLGSNALTSYISKALLATHDLSFKGDKHELAVRAIQHWDDWNTFHVYIMKAYIYLQKGSLLMAYLWW